MDRVDCIVVGAGVVGLAVAREIAMAGRSVIVLEEQAGYGLGISSRNSEVVHAGIYYPAGSLKATLCARGKRMLYNYCAERGVRAERVGKFIVATDDDQLAVLAGIRRHAEANGVHDLEFWNRDAVGEAEPQVRCVGALFSPGTGIVDSHGFMTSLLGDMEAHGGWLARGARVERIARDDDGFVLDVAGEVESIIGCDLLINAAGLGAEAIAMLCADWGGDRGVPRMRLAKGNYFSLREGRSPFRHLIYPVPVAGGLGTHATLDLGGQVRFGPDVEWIDEIDFTVDPGRAASFYPAIRAYWPELADGMLEPAYAGIRPKTTGPGEPAGDFLIVGEDEHGVPGLIHLIGIESPGLTSSMAIAERIVGRQSVAHAAD